MPGVDISSSRRNYRSLHFGKGFTCQVDILGGGPERGEDLRQQAASYGQEAENAPSTIVDQHHCHCWLQVPCTPAEPIVSHRHLGLKLAVEAKDCDVCSHTSQCTQKDVWLCAIAQAHCIGWQKRNGFSNLCSTHHSCQLTTGVQEVLYAHSDTKSLQCHRNKPVRSRFRPLMSCRKDTSPTTSVTGRFKPAAKPAAVLSTPSMPLAPLLDPTGLLLPAAIYPCCLLTCCHAAYMSMSRIGMLLPMNKPFPAAAQQY